ncbi:MAG: hypothetical protein ACXADW_17355 [Candidatus Hodarchaeales archaeon]|jgi:hypothetical protein
MIFDSADHFHMMGWWFSLFGPIGWLFMMLGIIIYIIISITIAYYVHKDALRRRINNSEVWLIIALIFNVLGLLLFILVRGNYNQRNTKNANQ